MLWWALPTLPISFARSDLTEALMHWRVLLVVALTYLSVGLGGALPAAAHRPDTSRDGSTPAQALPLAFRYRQQLVQQIRLSSRPRPGLAAPAVTPRASAARPAQGVASPALPRTPLTYVLLRLRL
jgi:hypothetical protein